MMIKKITAFIFVLGIASPAFAASVDTRVTAIHQQTQGNHSYHARLARKLANIASEEGGQHDLTGAKQFIALAEAEAQKAGGK